MEAKNSFFISRKGDPNVSSANKGGFISVLFVSKACSAKPDDVDFLYSDLRSIRAAMQY
jgi:hypothetical protein